MFVSPSTQPLNTTDQTTAEPLCEDSQPQLPRITVNNRQPQEVLERIIEVVQDSNVPPRLFRFGKQLVEVTADGELVAHDATRLRRYLWGVAEWLKVKGEGLEPADVPSEMVKQLLSDPPVPPLQRVTNVPVCTPDGRLLMTPGYDAGSQIYYRPSGEISFPEHPTLAEVKGQVEFLRAELFSDFPFVEDADKAAAFALLLEPFVRALITGPTPAYAIDALWPGSGKSLLAQVAVAVSLGDEPQMHHLADATEVRKLVPSILMTGTPAVIFDNVDRTVAGGALASVLTSKYPAARQLGHSKLLLPTNGVTWVLTGNRLQMSMELARRCVPICLRPEDERHCDTMNWRHPDLLQWVLAQRATVVSAIATLVQGWIEAGRPLKAATFGSYGSWAGVLGGILQYAGILGFLENRLTWMADVACDDDDDELREFVEGWWEVYGAQPVLSRQLAEAKLPPKSWLKARIERGRATKIGQELLKLVGQPLYGFKIEACGKDRKGRTLFRLVR
jgi:hypothetical protein